MKADFKKKSVIKPSERKHKRMCSTNRAGLIQPQPCCSPMVLGFIENISSTGQRTILLLKAFENTVGWPPSFTEEYTPAHMGTTHQHIQLLLSVVTALTATVHVAPGN